MSKIQYTKLREKPCGYNHSMIKRLRMLETTKGFISTSDNKIDVYMYRDTLKIIDFNPSSLSFTDSFNGDTYEQALSFEIPLINNQFYFHYNILEYINNRYYCIVETTDGKYIVGGYKSGMFPSYAIDENNITITLKTNATSNNTLISDYISFNEIDYNHCVGIDGECIDGLWTYKLIQRLNLDGSVSDEHYALNGYENDYTDINIVGTYSRFDTVFGIKLTNPLYDCFKQCYISGLPSSLIFKNTGETQCFTIESDCDFTYSYDITIIDVTFNEDTNEFCVKSLKMDSSTQIKIITSDGINRFINVVIGTVGGEEGEYDRIYRWYYNGETYCLDENQQINCESAKTTTDTITSGTCTYYKTELYISPLCDGKYDLYGYGVGDLISCERIYRWVVSDNETDYYCDYKTYTKYAMEVQEYSDDNGLTWIRTDNTRQSSMILEAKSEDCGYGGGYDGCDTIEFAWSSNSTHQFKVNDITYNAYTSPYSATLTDLGLTKFTSARYMFHYITDLTSVTKIPCTHKVTDMLGMFAQCHSLTSLDIVKEFDTSKVTTMYDMFYQCQNLTSLDLSSFNTSNVTDMGEMFYECKGLTSLDVSNFNTSKVTNMSRMFCICDKLTSLDLSSFDTSKVTNMSQMFDGSDKLSSITFGDKWNTYKVDNMECMFRGCSGLTSLDLSLFDTSYVDDIDAMFSNCTSLTSLDLSNWNLINVNYASSVFYRCNSLTSITMNNCNCYTINKIKKYLSDASLTNVTIITNTYCDESNSGSTSGGTDNPNTSGGTSGDTESSGSTSGGTDNPNTSGGTSGDTESSGSTTECTDTLSFSWSGTSATQTFKINNTTYTASTNPFTTTLSELGVDTFTNAYQMFFNKSAVTAITSIPCTNNVTNMYGMFFGCSNLTDLNLSNFNTSNVTKMSFMFSDCYSLTSLDLSSFNTSAVTVMHSMFYFCTGLTELDLSSFDTSNVTDMTSMFEYCFKLTSLDLSSFNTSNVTHMYKMFSHCNRLTSLDLSSFDTSNVTEMESMFDGCSSLTTIKVTNCSSDTISKLQEALTSVGYSSTVSNGIITVNH